jgi:hypothetical protein
MSLEFDQGELMDLMDAVRDYQHKENSLRIRCKNKITSQGHERNSERLVKLFRKIEDQFYKNSSA